MQYDEIAAIPWLLPGLGVSLVLAFALARFVGRRLRAGRPLSWALIMSVGIIVSATLTPSRGAIDSGLNSIRGCDWSRIGLAPIQEILKFGDTGLNVLLFVPLGVSIGLLPGSRHKAVVVVAAIALPFVIEAIQRLVPSLDRACETADIADNLTGLVIGLAAGIVARHVVGTAERGPR